MPDSNTQSSNPRVIGEKLLLQHAALIRLSWAMIISETG